MKKRVDASWCWSALRLARTECKASNLTDTYSFSISTFQLTPHTWPKDCIHFGFPIWNTKAHCLTFNIMTEQSPTEIVEYIVGSFQIIKHTIVSLLIQIVEKLIWQKMRMGASRRKYTCIEGALAEKIYRFVQPFVLLSEGQLWAAQGSPLCIFARYGKACAEWAEEVIARFWGAWGF